MDCQKCRGACCETFELPVQAKTNDDASRWLALHGTQVQWNRLSFECRCTKLTEDGRCSIYESRPGVCRAYEPGGMDCLRTVKTRRTPEEYQRIRGVDDPASL